MTESGRRACVAVVPAASQGLGLAIATELSRSGCRVAICSRNQESIERAAGMVSAETGGIVLPAAVDVTDGPSVDRWIGNVRETLGPPQILVTNSGGPALATILESTDADFRAAFDLVFFSALRLARAVLPGMRELGWGRIVSVSSYSARQPLAKLGPSVASRGALLGTLKLLADEVGGSGITVNSVLVGPVATDRVVELAKAEARAKGTAVELELKVLGGVGVVGRLGHAREVASMVLFLCSDEAGFVTGSAIPVDGGAIKSL
jgi:3-oxoacyl-[acyl-carrier protein] reductase